MTRPPRMPPGPTGSTGSQQSTRNALLERLLAEPAAGMRVTRSARIGVPAATREATAVDSEPPVPPPAAEGLAHLPDGVADRLQRFAGAGNAGRRRAAASDTPPEVPPEPVQPPAAEPAASETTAVPPPQPVPAAEPSLATGGPPRLSTAGSSEIHEAISASRRAFIGIGVLSFLLNILMLTGPLFMLQVYDRVMTSGSLPTLVALTALTALLYGMYGVFELIRTRIVARAGVEIDQRLSDRIFRASLRRSLTQPGAAVAALRDLDSVRQFASGPAPMMFFDAPWTPIYLIVIFLVHWQLGIAALLGAVLVVALTLLSERAARQPLAEANKAAIRSLDLADSAQRNVEALAAMGMIDAYRKRWQKVSSEALAWQIHAGDRIGSAASVGKTVRLLLQALMLAVGAALAIAGDISAGSIIAGTIIFGRALAPVEQAVGQWKSFIKARESFANLARLLRQEPEPHMRTALPAPKGHVAVAQLRVAAPDARKLILTCHGFQVRPGEVCAVVGPSASGKSTLARTLVGLWPAFAGSITIDGADLAQWNPEALGRHIGYLPQDVELFAGTVRDNICRFRDDAADAEVVEAAQMAHAHDMIVSLPKGYDTEVGSFATYLSAGQRQRIGLARALFGNPALVVLDEPNANLDRMGDEALTAALAGMKQRGQAVVLISHRVQAIGLADTLLFLDRGVQRAFGPRDEVMRQIRQETQPAAAGASKAPHPRPANAGGGQA